MGKERSKSEQEQARDLHPCEIELKLELPPRSLPRLTGSTLLNRTASARKTTHLTSVYYDTAKFKLRRRGLSLRVRRNGRHFVQTIKQEDGADAAVLSRAEWETELGSNKPDLVAGRRTALAPLLGSKKLRSGLRPVFATRVRRKIFEVRRGATLVELSIDRGKVEAGRHSAPFCEVELELKQGQVGDLFDMAKSLAGAAPIQFAVQSKADRGYALLKGEKPAPVKAGAVAIPPKADTGSAFQIIARACLHQLVANQPVLLNDDPEGLHQMRVALRRLRAAISLFGDMLSDPQTGQIKAGLKWITNEFGPAREFEVFSKRIAQPAPQPEELPKSNGRGMSALTNNIRQKVDETFSRARAAVDSERFRRLVLDVAAWIETGAWTRNPDDAACALREKPIADAAASELARRWKKIRKRGKHIAELAPARRHKLRIQAKKVRYAAEFFASVFSGAKAGRRRAKFGKRLETLQDALGDLNDISVNERLVARLAGADRALPQREKIGTSFAAGRLAGQEEARIAPALKQAEQAYRGLRRVKPFWA